MTKEPDPDLAIQAADRLHGSVDGLREEIANLRVFGKRNRHLIWGLAVSLVLDVCLSGAVTILAVKSAQAADRASETTSLATRNRDQQIVTCRAGNEARAAQVQLWTYVLDLVAQGPRPQQLDPQQAQRLQQLRGYLSTGFTARDCDASGPPPVSPPASLPVSPTR